MRSTQDLSGYLSERDDDPPPARTIPEKPAVGQRFMQAEHYGLWSVYGWVPSDCGLCNGLGHCGHPDGPACSRCNGTGNYGDEPECLASELVESDARLLAFGSDHLTACRQLLDSLRNIDRQQFNAAFERFRKSLESLTTEE